MRKYFVIFLDLHAFLLLCFGLFHSKRGVARKGIAIDVIYAKFVMNQ